MWYYIDNQGQQVGPISVESLKNLAAQGAIHQQSLVWTEGLDQWIEANKTEGIFEIPTPTAAVPIAVPSPSASQPIQIATAPLIASTPTTSPIKGTPVAYPNPYTAPATQSPLAAPEGDYPPTIKKGGSFGLLISLYIISIILSSVSSAIGVNDKNSQLTLILSLLIIVISITSAVLFYSYIYRAWAAIRPGGGTISPGKAVGFLFIPLFNIVWFFISFSRLPKEWNAITAQYNNTQNAPKFTPWSFICLGIPFINLVAIFIALPQLCRGITFMANLSKPKLSTPTSGSGLNFGPSNIKL